MEESIVVNEKYSNSWKTVFYSSLGIAAITFALYINIKDILWTGILRLIAFISFSISIFCMLKIMEGGKSFRLSVKDNSLHITYFKNNDIIHEEILDQEEIESIYKVPSFFRLPVVEHQFSLNNTCIFRVQFVNSNRDSSLFKFGGKVLSVDQKTGARLEEFLHAHNLYSYS